MQASVLEPRGRWFAAALGSIVVVVVLLMLFRFPAPPARLAQPAAPSVPEPKATVKMARPDENNRLLKEEAELRDLRPLFLPTERNAALPEPRLEPGKTFLDNETLKRTFTDAEAQVSKDLPPLAMLNGKRVEKAEAIDALNPADNPLSLEGFGRQEIKIAAVKTRSGYIEVTALKDGQKVLGQELPAGARPSGNKPWAPIEFMATVDSAGLVGPLDVIEGSRVEEVDSHFKNYLAQTFRIGEQLTPGFYRITVAP